MFEHMVSRSIKIFFVFLFLFFCFCLAAQAQMGKQPVTVNGDVVEFRSEGREIVAEGNVEIIGQDMRMSCDRVRVFMDEKLIVAEGNVKFEREGQEMEGEMVIFDFGERSGTMIDPHVRMSPYYGGAEVMEQLGAEEIVMQKAVVSTCDLPHPHYALSCEEVRSEPGKILRAKGVKVSILDIPVLYIPAYSHRLTDKRPRLMITPGHRKDYGMQIFGSWRYYLNQNAKGLLHMDWYQKQGWAEGIDLNYDTKLFGMGNAKYYRIDQQAVTSNSTKIDKERSRVEVRHKWQITDVDHAILEYFRSSDATFRKDYFYKEYERETQPRSFFLYSHVFPNATFSFLGQPRVNSFESVLQKIPEIKLETINQKIGKTNFYFKSTSSAAFLSNTTAGVIAGPETARVDTSNQVSYLFRWMGIDFSPFAGHQDTYYSRGVDGNESLMRGMFFSGVDMSLKLFKIYDVESNFLNLNINKLRHVLTPTLQYRYQHDPSLSASRIQQMDGIDSLDKLNLVTIGLENKLQTKRNDVDADLLRLLVSADYVVERNNTLGKGLRFLKYELELKPYSWWEFDSDAEYDFKDDHFNYLNAEFWTTGGRAQMHMGYRSATGESDQLTAGFHWLMNPFWKLDVYERFEIKSGKLVEQEYRLTRDLHCWLVEFIVNKRENEGLSVMVAFKIKAFPNIGINAEKTFTPPRSE